MRSGNPALSAKSFKVKNKSGEAMTIQGAANKTFLLLLLVLAPAAYVWNYVYQGLNDGADMTLVPYFMYGGIGGGLLFAIITIFKKKWAPITAPLYAIAEGFFLGGISAFMKQKFPGIVPQAVGLTFGTLFALLAAYKSGLIKATENFKLGVTAATGGIFLIYLVSFILGFFGIRVSFIHESGLIGIGFSAFVVIIAALNLVLDFDFIEEGAERGAPKYMEWYAAIGLMVTMIWLYIEILRLLAKMRK